MQKMGKKLSAARKLILSTPVLLRLYIQHDDDEHAENTERLKTTYQGGKSEVMGRAEKPMSLNFR